jgi:hypothetical protein
MPHFMSCQRLRKRAIGLVLDSIHRLVCGKQNTTTFRRLDLSPSSGGWGQDKPTQLGPLERASLNHIHHCQNPFKSIGYIRGCKSVTLSVTYGFICLHPRIIMFSTFKTNLSKICSELVIFMRMATDDKTVLLADPSAPQNYE